MEEYVGKGDDISLFKTSNNNQTVTGVVQAKVRYNVLYVPEGTRMIWSGAFCGLSVGAVILPDGVEKIQSCAFKNCIGFQKIFIPKSVMAIGKDAFAGCKELKICCEGAPQKDWLDKPDKEKVHYDDMTDAFNFHRSSGSFDDHYIVERVEVIRNTYNPEKRPVITGISRDEFLKLLQGE